MSSHKFFFLILLFTSLNFRAQHCPFDHSSLFIVSVKDSLTNTVINNLKITLVDNNKLAIFNKVIGPKLEINNYYNNDSIYVFHHNLKENFPKLTSKYYEKGLPVARGKYFLVLIGYLNEEKKFLKIEDSKGVYKTNYILIGNKNKLPLCTSLEEVWNDEKVEEKVTLNVLLTKKKKKN